MVAFDVIGTLFTLDRPRARLEELGAPPHALDLWFTRSLRDAFAWSHAGGYRPLGDFLRAALPETLQVLGIRAEGPELDRLLRSLRELDPAPRAPEAVDALAGAGWRIIALTNGSETFTRGLLDRAGLLERFAETISCDRIGKTKPHPDVYAMANAGADGEVWFVAAHAWDVAGASRAGLRTAWVGRAQQGFPAVYPAPDIIAADLGEAAEQLLDRTS